MNSDDVTLTAKVALLETRLADNTERLARTEATIEQLNRSIALGNRMTIWQFISFVVVMAGTLFGSLYWATGVLERRIDQAEKNLTTRIVQSEQATNERISQVEKNLTQVEKNLTSRFEDLRQVVLTKR